MTAHIAWGYDWLILPVFLLLLAGCFVWRTLEAINRERAYLARREQRRARLEEDIFWTLRTLEAREARRLHEEQTGIPAFAAGVETQSLRAV